MDVFLTGMHSRFEKRPLDKNGNEVVRFNLTQHVRDEVLIKRLLTQFNCGSYHLNKESFNYNVYGYRDNKTIIAPFF